MGGIALANIIMFMSTHGGVGHVGLTRMRKPTPPTITIASIFYGGPGTICSRMRTIFRKISVKFSGFVRPNLAECPE